MILGYRLEINMALNSWNLFAKLPSLCISGLVLAPQILLKIQIGQRDIEILQLFENNVKNEARNIEKIGYY